MAEDDMELLAEYKNGNLITKLYSDGTRIRETPDDEFHPAFAENVDVHISSKCDRNCPMCYANCSMDGSYGELFNWKFLDSLHAGTEMALNLNFPLHPKIYDFLCLLKEKGIITNVTVNQVHFEQKTDILQRFIDEGLIHGLGVSLVKATPEFVVKIKKFPNAVIHVINGLFNEEDCDALQYQGLKILILGFKEIGRGTSYIETNVDQVEKNKRWLYYSLKYYIPRFKVVSFDNLALEQLDVKRLLSDKEWEEFYGGDDGTFTFFINLVDGYFAKNSLSSEHYLIKDLSMDEMFDVIRQNN